MCQPMSKNIILMIYSVYKNSDEIYFIGNFYRNKNFIGSITPWYILTELLIAILSANLKEL